MNRAQDRAYATRQAQAEIDRRPVYLDTETTGLHDSDQIVEISIIDADGRVVFESLVRPLGRISIDAMRVHGITDAMVKNAPTWQDVWPPVEAALSGRRIGIYNADFDTRLMQQSHHAHHWPWQTALNTFCIMKLYARFRGDWNARYGNYRYYSLDEARAHCRLDLPNAHRATADALLARALLHYMAAAQ